MISGPCFNPQTGKSFPVENLAGERNLGMNINLPNWREM